MTSEMISPRNLNNLSRSPATGSVETTLKRVVQNDSSFLARLDKGRGSVAPTGATSNVNMFMDQQSGLNTRK